MAEFRRPAVFVREVPAVPLPPAAAPSALGIVGFTLKGPKDTATRVESFEEFEDIFGGFTPLSLVPLELDKFFNNGGQVAFVSRVTPVGSIKAEESFLGDTLYANGVSTGDGTTALFNGIIPNAPLTRAKQSITIEGNGTPGPYLFTVAGGFQPHTLGVRAGTQFAIDEPTSATAGGFVGDTAAGVIAYDTGVVSITFSSAVAVGTNVEVFTTTTQVRALDTAGVEIFAFDDGVNGLIGRVALIGPNNINYLTGEFDVNFSVVPDGGTTLKLRNDALLAAGNVAIVETVADGAFVVTGMAGGVDDVLPAIGTIVAVSGASLIDGETFVLDDGVNPAVTFEFDSDSTVTAGNVPVPFTGGDSTAVVAASMRAAINGATDLDISAEPLFVYGTRDRYLFQSQSEGEAGNDVKVEIQGSANFRKQERIGEFSTATLLDVGDGSVGPYTFTIPNAPLTPNTIAIVAGGQSASDDGSGSLVGDVTTDSSVDYTDGAVTVTFGTALAVGVGIRVHISGFSFFDAVISELDSITEEFIVKEVFETLELVDTASSDFISTILNDDQQGSSFVDVVTGQAGILPTLIRTVFNEQIDSVGIGTVVTDGTNRRFTATLTNLPIDPFTVKVFVEDAGGAFIGQEALDNGVGFFEGPNIDPFGVNQINYLDGTVDVTFKVPPVAGYKVRAIYTQQRVIDSIQLSRGSNGTGIITRSQIAVPALEAQKSGVFAFNSVEEALHIIVPDFAESGLVLNDLIDFAEGKKDRFIIGTTAENLTPAEAVNFRRTDIRSTSSFAAIYYPWVKTVDRSTTRTRTIPPLGHVAGMYSKVDRTRSEGKAPAGISDGLLLDIVGVERILEKPDQELIFPVNLNAILQAAGIGIFVNGARTLSSDKDFRYVNVRRVFIAIRKRAENDLRFALFEPIGAALFARISAVLTGIALEFFQKGALAGSTPSEAFDVVVDELNTPDLADQGIVKARLAIAPAKPAEFIVVELTVKQRESSIITATT